MASIASMIPEIDAIFIRPDKANRPFTVTKAVRLKGEAGWLMLDDKGMIHAVGRAHERVTSNAYIIGVTAEAGTTWGAVMEGLVALGKITQRQLDEHRRCVKERAIEVRRGDDLRIVRELCERNGWKAPTPEVGA